MPQLSSIVRRTMQTAVLLLACAVAHAQTDAASLTEARTFLQQGKLDAAEQTLRQLLLHKPADPNAKFLLARVLERKRLARESLALFTDAARTATPTAEDLRIVALDYVQLDDYPDALYWLQRSVQGDPANAEAWYDLARVDMMQGDFAAALAPLEHSLQLRPGNAKAENNLGLVLQSLNRPGEAEQAYVRAIAAQDAAAPGREQPLLNYATLLNEQQRFAEALPLLRRAAAYAPREPKIREQLARALEPQGHRSEALTQVAEAVRLDPKNAGLHFQAGQMYRRAGLVEKSREELLLSRQLYGTKSLEPNPDRLP